jgi:hypothetical protein
LQPATNPKIWRWPDGKTTEKNNKKRGNGKAFKTT